MANMAGIINDELQLTGNIQASSSLVGQLASNSYLTGEIIGMRGPKGEKGEKGDKGDPGTTLYSELSDKPSIEGVTLEGDTSLEDIGVVVDDNLSTTSTNLVTNRAVSQAVQNINNNMPVVETKTTTEWNNRLGYVPKQGAIIIYSDYSTKEKEIDGEIHTINIPNFKIGDGMAFVQDLPFVDEDLRAELENHIRNANIHVTLADKLFWNNKINITDTQEVMDEILIINRS